MPWCRGRDTAERMIAENFEAMVEDARETMAADRLEAERRREWAERDVVTVGR